MAPDLPVMVSKESAWNKTGSSPRRRLRGSGGQIEFFLSLLFQLVSSEMEVREKRPALQSLYWHSIVGAVALSVCGNSVTPSSHLQKEQVTQGLGDLG
jgi:hypothetical protein